MRKLARWAAKLYPRVWRERYGREVDDLLEDIEPGWREVGDILGRASMAQGRAFVESGSALCTGLWVTAGAPWQRAAGISFAVHALVIGAALMASFTYVAPLSLTAPRVPLPPPPPPPLPEMTDPRVFHQSQFLYTTLPLLPGDRGVIFPQIVTGVGISFPSLPDIGTVDRLRRPVRRVWPGQALEAGISRRVIPQFPPNVAGAGSVSVFLEYLIQTDGTVAVLRMSGPAPFAREARSAVEQWRYRPERYEGLPVETVSRVEVRFDAGLAGNRAE